MKWSWKLGRIAGIDVYVHLTFLLLLGWVGLTHLASGQGFVGAGLGVALIALLFGIVVLHELGHALAARSFGIPTRDITLYPIGGVARLARMPDKPFQEFVVAVAGPAVNVVLAAGFWLAGVLLAPVASGALGILTMGLVEWLFWANVLLAGFNLLPAFPMDGGRVLRAFLAARHGYLQGTETAVRVGRWMALVFAVVGFFYNPTLLLIAAFVYLAGGAELQAVRMRYAPSPQVLLLGRLLRPDFWPHYQYDERPRRIRDIPETDNHYSRRVG